MLKPAKSRAEEQFAATQKKAKQIQIEKDKIQQERSEHMAVLRELRLAKEATDKLEAEKISAEKAAAKIKKPKSLPAAHRR